MLGFQFKDDLEYLIGLIVLGLFSLIFFGAVGFRSMVGLLLVMLPLYSIFKNFDLEKSERIVFSFFSGLMLVSSLIYWIGFMVPFRISMIIVFVVLLGISYLLSKFEKKS